MRGSPVAAGARLITLLRGARWPRLKSRHRWERSELRGARRDDGDDTVGTRVTGDLGVSPGAAVTGHPGVVLSGTHTIQ